MKKLLPYLFIALLTPCLIKPAYAQATAHAAPPHSSDLTLSVEMFSDAGGADISPYMKNFVSDLKKHWLAQINLVASQQHLKQQETIIDLHDCTGRPPLGDAAGRLDARCWARPGCMECNQRNHFLASAAGNAGPESENARSLPTRLIPRAWEMGICCVVNGLQPANLSLGSAISSFTEINRFIMPFSSCNELCLTMWIHFMDQDMRDRLSRHMPTFFLVQAVGFHPEQISQRCAVD